MTPAASRAGAPRAGELLLTVDGGNSRVKLVLWEGAQALERTSFAWGDELASGLSDFLAPRARVLQAALSSVASADATQELCARLRELVGTLSVAPEHGLANATREPSGVGQDRLYAARGALELAGGSAIVVDAGTALTVDAVLDQGEGVFLGGAIAPGPELLARALSAAAGGAARLPSVRPEPGASALGRDTRAAIQAGIAVGFRGAARALVEGVAREAGLEAAPVVLAGGARGFLEGAFPGRDVRIADELVHRGLRHALARGWSRA